MKRILISSISFLIIICLCIFETHIISHVVNPLVDTIEIAYENDEISYELMTEARKNWDKSTLVLGIILRHNELDIIDALFVRSHEYAKNGDYLSFRIESRELIHRLNHLISKEGVSFKNIF